MGEQGYRKSLLGGYARSYLDIVFGIVGASFGRLSIFLGCHRGRQLGQQICHRDRRLCDSRGSCSDGFRKKLSLGEK